MVCSLFALAVLAGPGDSFADRGLATLARVRYEFRLPSGLYCESLRKREPAFNWGVGVLMSAMAGAAMRDPAWRSELRSYVEATRVYWNPAGPVPGYDVLPMPKDVDRYYDDNAWMVLALVEASDVLAEPKFLAYAGEALTYVLSGRDDKLGGGIYWREKPKESKNTCSNGPSAAACLAVYEKTRDPKLLAAAQELYAWTKAHLQDPADHLFWDAQALDGTIERTKWSYNTALMIQTAADLARVTGDSDYALQAEAMAEASRKRWLVDGRLKDEGKFAFLLLDSWNRVPSAPRSKAVREAMGWLWSSGRDAGGWFGNRFDRTPSKTQDPALIDQAAAARAMLVTP